jgi:hypothetical protein
MMAPIGAVHASPQSCLQYSSTNNTSSDSNAFAKVVTYTCPGGSSGTGEWEVYNLGTYTASGTITVCGTNYSVSNAHDFQYGYESYGTSNQCNPNESSGFATNTLGSHAFPIESGATTTNETVWSGVCNNGNYGSPCVASTYDSAP